MQRRPEMRDGKKIAPTQVFAEKICHGQRMDILMDIRE